MIDTKAYGLSDQEYKLILDTLGRQLNHQELGIFSAMWSEHCSYKHTRSLLNQFPTHSNHVIIGPGENAGVVSIDEQWAVAFKIESHNHPSYVAPYEGASTGVGGLLRDIIAMGARPLGVKALLRSGPPEDPIVMEMVTRIRKGSQDYIQGCRLASLGLEWRSHPSFTHNPLVNVVALGIVHKDKVMRSSVGKPGNLIYYFGKRTSSDGVDGAAFASKGMGQTIKASPPGGDPAVGYQLMNATLELVEKGLVEGLQDMGAAGLTCSTFEMASKGNCGFELDLDLLPVISSCSTYELLLSETQERMLAAISSENLTKVNAVLQRYPDLHKAVLGKVTADDLAVVRYRGQVDVTLPIRFVVDGYPRICLKSEIDAKSTQIETLNTELDLIESLQVKMASIQGENSSALTTEPLTSTGQLCSEVEIPNIGQAVLLRTISGDADTVTDPIACGRRIVRQAYDDLRSEGAQPLALCDGLNFGDPNSPQVANQILGTIHGIADACKELSLPVVGGNVSLYNETAGKPILGQAFIAMIGVKPIPMNK